MLQIQLRQGGHGFQHIQIPQSVVVQVKVGQVFRVFETRDGAQGALRHGQAGQRGQRRQNRQLLYREGASGQIQHYQLGQGGQAFQRGNLLFPDGQLGQIGEVAQVREILHTLRRGEFRDTPQGVGVHGAGTADVNQFSHGGFHGSIGKFHLFNHAGNGVIQRCHRADQPVLVDRNGTDLCLTGGQGNPVLIYWSRDGGVLAVGGVVHGVGIRGKMHVNVLAEKAGFLIGLRRGGAQGLNLLSDCRIGDIAQHLNGVHQLVLLHIDLTQGGV